jgi:branched-subunit amino acid transport protein AzlD
MNHTLQSLNFRFNYGSTKLDLEELVQPLIMDESGHQANSTLTDLGITFATQLSTMSPVGATLARMLRKNSSIKHLDLRMSALRTSVVEELIPSLVENHSLETLNLNDCFGFMGVMLPAMMMDVLLVNFTLKDIELRGTTFDFNGTGLAIKEQLRKNEMYRKLHLKELELAEPTSARVIFCGFPYAGMY